MYSYDAEIVDVYDGDTFTFYVDLGFEVWVKSKLRLAGCNTPEVRGANKEFGFQVRDYVRSLILDKMVRIKVYKKGKFGRYVADVWPFENKIYTEFDKFEMSLTDHLIDLGMAEKVNYD